MKNGLLGLTRWRQWTFATTLNQTSMARNESSWERFGSCQRLGCRVLLRMLLSHKHWVRFLRTSSQKLRLKFDVAFFIASEQLPFTKYPWICELEQRYGVKLGAAYLNNKSCKEFTHYIAETNEKSWSPPLAMHRSSHFLSVVPPTRATMTVNY